MKYLALLPIAFMLGTPAIAETINPYQEKGCAYDGDVGKDGKPSGKGTWKCQDGRSYVGAFKDGKFDGKGVYTVSSNSETFIEPFSSNSAKLRNMTLEGVFKKRQGARKLYRLPKRHTSLHHEMRRRYD